MQMVQPGRPHIHRVIPSLATETAPPVIRIRVQCRMTAPCAKTPLLPVILQAVKVRDLVFMAVRVQSQST